ncbi:MAG: hypothetical protein JO168_22145 [Solirubrobacterales bacterium]|nr:hypothetical protein [Solirubrobacterales bacterium]
MIQDAKALTETTANAAFVLGPDKRAVSLLASTTGDAGAYAHDSFAAPSSVRA